MKVRVTIRDEGDAGFITKIEAQNIKGQFKTIKDDDLNRMGRKCASFDHYVKPVVDPTPGAAPQVIVPIPHQIVYLDCGLWGGPTPIQKRSRTLGLVWTTWAAVVSFEPFAPQPGGDTRVIKDQPPDHPINAFCNRIHLNGHGNFTPLGTLFSGNPNYLKRWVQDQETVFVILPDFHMPVVTSPPNLTTGDGHHMGRFDYRADRADPVPTPPPFPDDNGMVRGGLGKPARTWFERYLRGDIFGGPNVANGAAEEMIRLLDGIEAAIPDLKKPVHFVQVGDMYDLWIGLNRFFSRRTDDIVLLSNEQGILAGNFIDHWVTRTRTAFASAKGTNVVDRLNRLATLPTLKTSWLWGNHDNYLSRHTPVVPAGHPAVPTRVRTAPGSRFGSIGTGLLIEHGHKVDSFNCDGAVVGHAITQEVFAAPLGASKFQREMEPDRRELYTAYVAARYLQSPDFHIFAMGHTHVPLLTRIDIEIIKA